MNVAATVCCEFCEYVKKSERDLDVYVCRRFPPHPQIVPMNTPAGMGVHCIQPVVHGVDWCAEFSMSETAFKTVAEIAR